MKKILLIISFMFLTAQLYGSDIFNIQPAGGATIVNNDTMRIKWIYPDTTGDEVNIWLWNGFLCTFTLIDSNVSASAGQYNWYIDTENFSSKYRVKIQSVNNPEIYGFNTGYFSIVDSANPASDVSDLNNLKGSLIKVYPNPLMNNQFTITSVIPFENSVLVNIYNLQGTKVTSLTKGNVIGSNSFSVNVPELQPGIYFFEIITSGNFTTRKVVIQK
ncbi:MAG: T9SS type A sorting domain-containing protein [Ignavibacteriae bacterium]|nr:T9SS type A sorting domain-containing protein [Ignavibacteriota bacterium]